MALPEQLEHEYIIGNIFVNILSMFKSFSPKSTAFNGLYLYRKKHYNN